MKKVLKNCLKYLTAPIIISTIVPTIALTSCSEEHYIIFNLDKHVSAYLPKIEEGKQFIVKCELDRQYVLDMSNSSITCGDEKFEIKDDGLVQRWGNNFLFTPEVVTKERMKKKFTITLNTKEVGLATAYCPVQDVELNEFNCANYTIWIDNNLFDKKDFDIVLSGPQSNLFAYEVVSFTPSYTEGEESSLELKLHLLTTPIPLVRYAATTTLTYAGFQSTFVLSTKKVN